MQNRTYTFRLIAASLIVGSVGWSGPLNASDDPNAVIPGVLRATPTIHCIGLYWPLQGDANGNAMASVEFQEAGSTEWKKAMPLWRVVPQAVDVKGNTVGKITVLFGKGIKNWGGMKNYLVEKYALNYIAGSIFNLKPGTRYVIRVKLSDPDGGGIEQTVEATTRAVPVIPTQGNIIEVKGGGTALAEAVARAQPGDIFNVRPGTYSSITVNASGSVDKPIVIQGVGSGNNDVIIQGSKPLQNTEEGSGCGIELNGSNVHLHKLCIKECFEGIRIRNKGSTNLSVTRCSLLSNYTSIYYAGSNGYYADNLISGIKGPVKVGDVTEGHAFDNTPERSGPGNVMCYNTITRVSDALRLHCSDADAYGNDVLFGSDDAVEFDDGGPNLRLWGNRFSHPGNNGISFQPYIGGPAYVIRNVVFVGTEDVIKDRYKSCGAILLNNTFIEAGSENSEAVTPPEHVYARNNLFISYGRSSLKYHAEDFVRSPATLDLDYNGYNKLLGAPASAVLNVPAHAIKPLAEMREKTGLEVHGIQFDPKDCFQEALPSKEEIAQALKTWTSPHPDFSLKKDSPAIDKGTVIPNVVEEFAGAAPDLGAIEFGAPTPQWGVRPEGVLVGTSAVEQQGK